jgi:hypothetical protein
LPKQGLLSPAQNCYTGIDEELLKENCGYLAGDFISVQAQQGLKGAVRFDFSIAEQETTASREDIRRKRQSGAFSCLS